VREREREKEKEKEKEIHPCLEVVLHPERESARQPERERVEREGRVHLAFGISVNKFFLFCGFFFS